jgi:membrane protease YdiL (CAAX protease family)
LGFRIFLFLALTAAGTIAISFLVPAEMPYGAVPLLVGTLIGGWAMLRLDGRGPGALGFYLAPSVWKEALMGMGLGVIVAGFVVVAMVGFGALRWYPEAGSALEYFQEGGASLWFFTIPAAGEEALMRGYLFQALAEAWGGAWALWITSFLFGILHLGNPNTSWIGLANILVAGLFLGIVYLKTASLWWATGAHLGWNWAHGFLADLPVSGWELVDTPLLEPLTRGPEWLSGGSFGPEGSILSTLILLGATAALWKSSLLRLGDRAREVRPLFLAGEGEGRSPGERRGGLENR